MRPTTVIFLAAICIGIAMFRGYSSRSVQRLKPTSKPAIIKVAKPPEIGEKQVLYSRWTKPSFGEDEDSAKQLAVKDAQKELESWLRNRKLKWPLPQDYVQEHIRDKEVVPDKTLVDNKPMTEVKLLIDINDADYQEILNFDRKEQRENNQLLLARIIATIVTICAAVSGYLRLDEATKGYYTNLLRLGSLAVVSVVGAGLWLVA
jgi:hypothetical protein